MAPLRASSSTICNFTEADTDILLVAALLLKIEALKYQGIPAKMASTSASTSSSDTSAPAITAATSTTPITSATTATSAVTHPQVSRARE